MTVESCAACGGDALAAWRHKSGYPLLRCRACGTIVVDAVSPPTAALYDSYYDRPRVPTPAAAAASLARVVRSMAGSRTTGRWLDVGYGEGALLSAAEAEGWQCYGVELSPHALEDGRGRGWVVAKEADADGRFPAAGFDVVSMVEFLEHLPSPRPLLETARRYLRPGGVLFVTTPNADSLNRRLLQEGWSVVAPPEHLTLWTRAGLRRALSECGFETQSLRTEGLNPCEILARWRPAPAADATRAGVPSLDRVQSGVALNAAFSGSPSRRALKLVANAALNALGIGDTLKAWAVRTR
jgi:SAM-dependent methyltransferase